MIRALIALLLLTAPVIAAADNGVGVAPPSAACQYYMDEIFAGLTSEDYFVTMISDENMPKLLAGLKLAGQLPPGVITRAFVVDFASTLMVGIEADGCLLPPFIMALGTPAALRHSGRTPNGTFA